MVEVPWDGLMELAVDRQNCLTALRRVRSNKGSPAIDGMTVWELAAHLKEHWLEIRADLLAGRYRPRPVRRVTIAKPGGGEREHRPQGGGRCDSWSERAYERAEGDPDGAGPFHPAGPVAGRDCQEFRVRAMR
jgi:hypothetical protein